MLEREPPHFGPERRSRMKSPPKSFYIALLGGSLGALVVLLVSEFSKVAKISAGDWLQALSTILGIGLTVRGTLWLEERKRRQQHVDDHALLRTALTILRGHIAMIRNLDDQQQSRADRATTTAGHYELIRNARASLADAKAGLRVQDYNLWSALHALDQEFDAASITLENEERIIRGRGVSEDVLRISRERLHHVADAISQPVDAAIAALQRPAP